MRGIDIAASIVALGLAGCGNDDEPRCDGPAMTGAPRWSADQPAVGDGATLSVTVPVTPDARVVSVMLSSRQPLPSFPAFAGIGSAMNASGAAEVVVRVTVTTDSSVAGTYFLQIQLSDRTGTDPNIRGATYVLFEPSDTDYTLVCARSPTPQETSIPVPFVTVQ